MSKNIWFFFVLISLIACGKINEPPKTQNKVFRQINPVVEGNFSTDEKLLGDSFCSALSFKRANFGSLYAAPSKLFRFELKNKVCDSETESKYNQDAIYSTSSGLSYASASMPAIVPTVETEASGVFALYCANRAQNERVFKMGNNLYVYHFYTGQECAGELNQVCAIYEKADSSHTTVHYKKMIVSVGAFLGLNLRGQEVMSLEINACSDSEDYKSQQYILRSVSDI